MPSQNFFIFPFFFLVKDIEESVSKNSTKHNKKKFSSEVLSGG